MNETPSFGSRRGVARTALLFAVLLLLAFALYYAWALVAIGAAHTAKTVCSGAFVSQRPSADVLGMDMDEPADPLYTLTIERQGVTSSFFGLREQRAIFRAPVGCTILAGADEAQVRAQTLPLLPVSHDDNLAAANTGVARVESVLDELFASGRGTSGSRAVVILHRGRVIAERYAPGFTAETPLLGYSLGKSVINALIGVLVKEGRLSLSAPPGIAAWSAPDDPRRAITVDQLLRMSSGLTWDGRTGPTRSDENLMLFRSQNVAAYAVAKPLRYTPGTHWQYVSGNTNILASAVCDRAGGSLAACLQFARAALFAPLGMNSMTIEPDASGHLIASAFVYATARDWARFGQLYLQDGVWQGRRILPESWGTYSATPAPADPSGAYGAHFWTNRGVDIRTRSRRYPQLPADMFFASGDRGQRVVIIPSRQLVVVHLGWYPSGTWDMGPFIAAVIAALGPGA